MDTPINLFVGRIASSRARSFLVYRCDMPRHSLIELLAIRLSPQAGKSLVMRGSLRCLRDTVAVRHGCGSAEQQAYPPRMLTHRRVRPAIPKNKFLEVS
jgi:hypothetical protein